MSKYTPLWQQVQTHSGESFTMTFDEIKQVLGFEIDHSFLTFKKELPAYGWQVGKISIKGQTVAFLRIAV